MANGKKALSVAAAKRDLVKMKSLLETEFASATANEKYTGLRPIHKAAVLGLTDVFERLAESNDDKETFDTIESWNCLDLAIDNNHAETALKIIEQKNGHWEKSLETISESFEGLYDTPMRKLIRNMPEIARVVLNKCTSTKSNPFQVTFNYTYLDDTSVYENWRLVKTIIVSEANRQRDQDPVDQFEKGSAKIANRQRDQDPVDQFEKGSAKIAKIKSYTQDRSLIKENHPLMIMVKSNRTELVDHPLVSALLKRTWSIGLIITIMNFLLYAVFLTMLTGFTLSLNAPYTLNMLALSNNSNCSGLADYNISSLASVSKYGVFVMTAIELLIQIVEITQMYPYRGLWSYFAKLENWFEWIACVGAVIFVFDTNDCHDTGFRQEWQWTCGTISVFLAWINMLAILRKFEWIGIYVVMLHRIVNVFTKFFFVFSLLIVAFAIAFHCLFQNQDQFSTFGLSLVKTTSMMVGEIDFGNTFFEENVHFGFLSFAFYYLFVLLMTIVVINLLVGLAVENIHEFKRNAGLAKRQMQVEFALDLERFSTRNLLLKICYSLINSCRHDNTCIEVLVPDNQGWLQSKWDKLWKLTEHYIKSGLKVEEDIPGSISKLNKKIDTLETKIETLMGQLENVINTEESIS